MRPRQLSVRTLLAGMCLAQADHRPAHLTRVHQALTSLPRGRPAAARRDRGLEARPAPADLPADRVHLRPGRGRARQGRARTGCPPARCRAVCDGLLEASVPEELKDASRSLAVDWTDLESFSRPPPHGTSDCADPEASWGHRKNNLLRSQDELFYGYYLSAGVMMPEENGPAVPELARRAALSSCRHDPVRAFAPVLTAMPGQGIPLGDILDDSGYAHRDAGAWAIPLRAAGAQLVQDLHPHDRGPKGTHDGAIISNGNLYCPQTPRPLLELGPLARTATKEQAADHDRKTSELARYKLGRLTADDPDGYHRVQCPAAMGKIRCPLRPASMTAGPGPARRSCSPRNIPRPAAHSRPSPSRRTCSPRPRRNTTTRPRPGAAPTARRTGAERGFATAKDPASQRHQPRLVPPDGPGTPDAVHRDPAHRPQPAHPARLEHPAGRKPAPRSRRAAPENPQTAPQDPRRPRRRAALTRNRHDHEPRARHHQPGQPPQPGESTP